jgi:hypothetical protein
MMRPPTRLRGGNNKGDSAMRISPGEQQLRDHFFKVLLEATLPLQPGPEASTWSIGMSRTTLPSQPGPSHEVALEALIDASQMLTEHLRLELDELRHHQDE